MIPSVPHIAAMQGYALANLDAPSGRRTISLSQNECLRPPSPKAVAAAAEAVAQGALYPDPNWSALRAALSARHDLRHGTILCGVGSLELIGALTRAYADPGNAVLAPCHAYQFFRTAAALANARFDTAEEVAGAVSVDNLIAGVRADTRIVFVANPGNPTGTRITGSDIRRLRDGLPGDVLLVVDEAYGEFTDHLDEGVFDLVARGDTVVLRSLSKAYGLAGLRVGWGLFPSPVAENLRKVLNPNNISVAGQAAATAAVLDHAYMRTTCEVTATRRDAVSAQLRQAGFDVPPSHANFLLIRFDTARLAAAADATLRAQGVVLRGQGGAGLAQCLRMTIGQADDMAFAVALLQRWKNRRANARQRTPSCR